MYRMYGMSRAQGCAGATMYRHWLSFCVASVPPFMEAMYRRGIAPAFPACHSSMGWVAGSIYAAFLGGRE